MIMDPGLLLADRFEINEFIYSQKLVYEMSAKPNMTSSLAIVFMSTRQRDILVCGYMESFLWNFASCVKVAWEEGRPGKLNGDLSNGNSRGGLGGRGDSEV
jgi:hypothetical protein